MSLFETGWLFVKSVFRIVGELMLLSPRSRYEDNASDVICKWPFVAIRVFRFGLKFGAIIGFSLFTHILYVLHTFPSESMPLTILCATKILLWFPTPYFFIKKNLQLDVAERLRTSINVGLELCSIVNSNRIRDRRMVLMQYTWFATALCLTAFATDQLAHSIWNHALCSAFFMMVHRVACTILFMYLSQVRMTDSYARSVLDSCSTCRTVVSEEAFANEETEWCISRDGDEAECSICCDTYEIGNRIRTVSLCKHIFHQDCADRWFLEHNLRCPLCQMILK
eukprot:GEMP01075253.1.p1 GENE.GEMP01075253.1~~GEMP01075253.1.p1  ORF type:complete len:282 (+),score=30.07 GEMP01075253.1:203-1048(+)